MLIPVHNWHEWDLHLETSKQKNFFLMSSYLQTCNLFPAAKYLIANNKILGGIVIPELHIEILTDPIISYSKYHSIWFTPEVASGFRQSQKQIEILFNLGEFLSNSGVNLNLSLHWSIQDLRGIDWAFYGNQNRRIQFTPRYTGILNLSKFNNFSEYLKTVSSGRKADYRLSRSLNIAEVFDTSEISIFMHMYEMTVPFSDANSKSKALNQVKHIIQNSMAVGTGTLWLAKNNQGEVLSGVFIQKYDDSLYYQFGASYKYPLKYSPNAAILMNIIERAVETGISKFDFMGMNSPKRGEFKASLNPTPQLYFEALIQ